MGTWNALGLLAHQCFAHDVERCHQQHPQGNALENRLIDAVLHVGAQRQANKHGGQQQHRQAQGLRRYQARVLVGHPKHQGTQTKTDTGNAHLLSFFSANG